MFNQPIIITMKDFMKPLVPKRNSWAFVAFICLMSNVVSAQISVVSYMKVEPGKWDTYLQVIE